MLSQIEANALLSGQPHYGVHPTIVTDSGRQFESQLWNNLMSLLSSKCARTTVCHPRTIGMVERFHRQLKTSLKAQPNHVARMDSLPQVILLSISMALKEDISSTAAEKVYGTILCLPKEFFTPSPIGPFPVISRTNIIDMHGCNDKVSINRFKPAHLDATYSDSISTSHSSHPTNLIIACDCEGEDLCALVTRKFRASKC